MAGTGATAGHGRRPARPPRSNPSTGQSRNAGARRLAGLLLLLSGLAVALWLPVMHGQLGRPVPTTSTRRFPLLAGAALTVGFLVFEGTQAHIEVRRQTFSLSLSEAPLVVGLALVASVGPAREHGCWPRLDLRLAPDGVGQVRLQPRVGGGRDRHRGAGVAGAGARRRSDGPLGWARGGRRDPRGRLSRARFWVTRRRDGHPGRAPSGGTSPPSSRDCCSARC